MHLKCHLRTFCRAGMQLIIVGRQQRASSSPCNPDGKMCAFMDKLRHFERRPAGSHCGSKKTFALSSQYQHNTMLKKLFVGIFIIYRFLTWSGTYFLRESGAIYPLETTEVSGNWTFWKLFILCLFLADLWCWFSRKLRDGENSRTLQDPFLFLVLPSRGKGEME